jgi:hypothetical protein
MTQMTHETETQRPCVTCVIARLAHCIKHTP